MARKGLSSALCDLQPGAHWGDVGQRYRKILFGIGCETSVKLGLSREAVAKVFEAGGKLSLAQLLRCRVRYFSDGLAVGRESFIESLFHALRGHFSQGREDGSRRMKGGDWGEMRSARALQVKPIDAGGD